MGEVKRQLHTRGDVRAAIKSALWPRGDTMQSENSEAKKRALAAAAYLVMLAEQVRDGTIVAFDATWSGADEMDVKIRTVQPASYIQFDMQSVFDSVHCADGDRTD